MSNTSNDRKEEKPFEYSEEQLLKVFGPKSDSALASKIKRENPNRYSEMKVQAISLGILPEPTIARLRREMEEKLPK